MSLAPCLRVAPRRAVPLLVFAALFAPAPAAAGPKDDAFVARRDAFRTALASRDREDAPAVEEALKAILAFAGTRDERVLKELTKPFAQVARQAAKARADLDEAAEKLAVVQRPYLKSVEDYYRAHGSMPETILTATKDALETLGKAEAEAARRWDDQVRILDAMKDGIGRHLESLGADRDAVFKEAVQVCSESKEPELRAAFAAALERLPGSEPENVLLAVEKREQAPAVVVAVIESLGRRRSEAGFPRLLSRLESPDFPIAAAAISAVARYRRPEVVPALIGRLKTAEGRITADLLDTLFSITGKHVVDTFDGWNSWWTREGPAFLLRWSPDKETRRKAIDDISAANAAEIDVPAEIAACLPTEPDPEVRQDILENLSIHRSNFARAVLLDVLRDPDEELRLAAIRGLAHYRHLSVPEALMRLVDSSSEDELYEVFNSLRTLWGGAQEFSVTKPDREALHRWWTNNRDRVARHFIELGARDVAAGRREPSTNDGRWQDRNFYGIEVRSQNALFVVDVSFSMEEPAVKGREQKKIDVAKAELTRAVSSMAEGGTFGVIVFSGEPEVYGTGMMPATAENKKAATTWVSGLNTRAATNIFDTLELCFALGTDRSPLGSSGAPDTIFFVSDGAPTAGKFTDAGKILEHVRRWNKSRRLRIHAIGVGEDHDIEFLRKLSEESGGFYVAR